MGAFVDYKLLAMLVQAEADKANLLSKLWETDPEGHGANAEEIAHARGQAEGLRRAVRFIEQAAACCCSYCSQRS